MQKKLKFYKLILNKITMNNNITLSFCPLLNKNIGLIILKQNELELLENKENILCKPLDINDFKIVPEFYLTYSLKINQFLRENNYFLIHIFYDETNETLNLYQFVKYKLLYRFVINNIYIHSYISPFIDNHMKCLTYKEQKNYVKGLFYNNKSTTISIKLLNMLVNYVYNEKFWHKMLLITKDDKTKQLIATKFPKRSLRLNQSVDSIQISQLRLNQSVESTKTSQLRLKN